MGLDLDDLAKDLCTAHGAHTVILYGSHARGDARPASDVDVFVLRDEGDATSDHRIWCGRWLDAWVHPLRDALAPDASLLRLHGGRVLVERDGHGAALLARVEALYAAGPAPLPAAERALRVTWLQKTAARVREAGPDDVEALVRRAALLVEALETYFVLRGRWYPGPRPALATLATEDPETLARYTAALRDPARPVDDLVARVLGDCR